MQRFLFSENGTRIFFFIISNIDFAANVIQMRVGVFFQETGARIATNLRLDPIIQNASLKSPLKILDQFYQRNS